MHRVGKHPLNKALTLPPQRAGKKAGLETGNGQSGVRDRLRAISNRTRPEYRRPTADDIEAWCKLLPSARKKATIGEFASKRGLNPGYFRHFVKWNGTLRDPGKRRCGREETPPAAASVRSTCPPPNSNQIGKMERSSSYRSQCGDNYIPADQLLKISVVVQRGGMTRKDCADALGLDPGELMRLVGKNGELTRKGDARIGCWDKSASRDDGAAPKETGFAVGPGLGQRNSFTGGRPTVQEYAEVKAKARSSGKEVESAAAACPSSADPAPGRMTVREYTRRKEEERRNAVWGPKLTAASSVPPSPNLDLAPYLEDVADIRRDDLDVYCRP